MENIYAQRIAALRQMMLRNGWDAVVVGGSDPHASEYPAPRWKQVEWLTGFTGEAGDVVVTRDHAGLWTDSRYFIQALTQLEGTGVELHKTRVPDAVMIPEWLTGRARVVAVDGLCQSLVTVRNIQKNIECGDSDDECRIVDVPDLL
jgi:Xaa-Pro aminopeptidase